MQVKETPVDSRSFWAGVFALENYEEGQWGGCLFRWNYSGNLLSHLEKYLLQAVWLWPQQKSGTGFFWLIPVDGARHFFICAPECFAESWQSFSEERVFTFAPSGDVPHNIAVGEEKLFLIRYPTGTWPESNAAGQLSGFIRPAERSVFTVTCPRASALLIIWCDWRLCAGFRKNDAGETSATYTDSCRPAALRQEVHIVALFQVDVLACTHTHTHTSPPPTSPQHFIAFV